MMATSGDGDWDWDCDKDEIGFIDFADDKSVFGCNVSEEGPVVISSPFPVVGGKPQSVFVGDISAHSITIQNTTAESVELWGVKIYCSIPSDSFTLSLMKPPPANSDPEDNRGFFEAFSLEDRVIWPHRTLTIWISCKPKEIGLHTSVVHFDVGDDRIERVAFVLAEDKVSQSLASQKPYSRVPRRKHSADKYIATPRPAKPITRKFKLPEFPIPIKIRELLANKQVPEVITEGLTRANYVTFFSTLLNMEEIHLEEEMRCHDMECVTFRQRGPRHFALEVPGLAERRPSLVIGDFVFAGLVSTSADKTTSSQGSISRVEADEVFLRFDKEFLAHHRNGNLYNVRFMYNRVNMRRLYQAVEASGSLERSKLFPSQMTSRRLIKTTPIIPYTCLNKEQLRCVEKILGCEGAPPYVIHGPPGTGKTMTLVEAILQLYTKNKSSRILVCAASNSAADHVLEKLIGNEVVNIKETEIFRLNASSRLYEDVHPNFIRFCFFQEFIFKCPPLQALMKYRIIISTFMSASHLYAEGIHEGHFSHIFLDEAGQVSEPEAMIPISNLSERGTVIVLAGDPMQLGPVVLCKYAETLGLGKSYLQRLFGCKFYYDEDENYVTKLVRNYRSHPAILDLPSKLFYSGQLIACKEDIASSINCYGDILPNKDFPVLFIGIQGCDEREGNNPSWFNRIEVSKVVEVIKKLRESTELSEAEIGVIAPYRQQVVKIMKVLEGLDMPNVKVGSVEQFQGQEKEVIIVSTVRSTVKHKEFDKTYCLGFLSNPRRFNVAITRAKSLLVIVGNPHIVCKDPHWDKLLRLCSSNNSYQGCPLPLMQQNHGDEESDIKEILNYEKGGTSIPWENH